MGSAARHIAARGALAAFGGVVAAGWLLVLPLGTHTGGTAPVRAGPEASAGASRPESGEESGEGGPVAADLVLPVAAVGTAGAAAAYAHVRRTRRTRTRTTPAAAVEPVVPSDELDRRGRRLLVETDDCVRTSAEELGFVAERYGEDTARPFAQALECARGELAEAFRLRQMLDDASDRLSADDRRRALEEIVRGCTQAGHRLDAQAPAFDQVRALERDPAGALEHAENRFRELTGRVRSAGGKLTGLHERYAPDASRSVEDHVEQAKDRLVFATSRLNRARQALDRGDPGTAALRLRAAEGAVHQADLLAAAVGRLAAELAAAERLPEARRETADGPYDPLDALRRLVHADVGADGLPAHSLPFEQDGAALREGAVLVAESDVAAVRDFVTTHRGAVGSAARTRLAEAERHLVQARDALPADGPRANASPLIEARRAGFLAQEARRLAERDVRAYGDLHDGPLGDGLGVALLGGVLLADVPGGGDGLRGPACYGGPGTRGRRTASGRV